MRPVVVTAILLLVVLMSMSVSAAWNPAETCKTKYPAIPCRNTNLGEGWSQMGNDRCVKAFYDTEHLVQADAEMACRKRRKGYLVSIHDAVELNQVICAMYRATPGKAHYWIGGFREQYLASSRWVWLDDNSKFAYTNWARGQPDFYLFKEWCIEMNYQDWGLWNDVNCKEKKPYVCVMNLE